MIPKETPRNMKILKFDEFSRLYETDFSVSEPVGLAVLGAPAGGKSYTVNKIKDVTNDARLKKALASGVDLTVDKLRAEFQSKNPIDQLEGFLKSFYVMRDKSVSEPSEYGKWFDQIKNLWSEKISSLLPELKIDMKKDELYFGDELAINHIKKLKELEYEKAKKTIDSLDKYNDYKRVVRYFQSIKQDDAIDKVLPITYDEAGDEPNKIISNMKKLHDRGYVTDVFLIHPSNIASNLIQNYFRVISGKDGGRDSSAAIIQAFKDIEAQKDIYSKNAEKTIVLKSKNIEDAEEELRAATVSDDKERGDKPIDVLAEIRPMSPEEGYKIFSDNLKKEKPGDEKLLTAMLKFASVNLSDLPSNAKKSLETLTKSMSNKEAVNLLKKAADEKTHLFKYGGITTEISKKASNLLT
jgi:hypothetical protein